MAGLGFNLRLGLERPLVEGAAPPASGPLVSLDFQNGIYLLNGSPVAVTDLVYESPNQGEFDLAKIIAGQGLRTSVSSGTFQNSRTKMALKPAIAAPLLLGGTHDGMTVVASYSYTGTMVAGAAHWFGVEQGDFANYAAEVGYWHLTSDPADPTVWDYGGASPTIAKGAGSTYKMAMSLTASSVAASVDGNAIQVRSPTADNSAVNEIYFGLQAKTGSVSTALATTLHKIEFFPPVDPAELATLSGA